MRHIVLLVFSITFVLGLGQNHYPMADEGMVQAQSTPTNKRDNDSNWEWEELPPVLEDELFTDCDFLSNDNGWAITLNGGLIHWDGHDWTVSVPPSSGMRKTLSSIDMIDEANGWAVGGEGTMLRWNGKEWSEFPPVTDYYMTDASFISPDFGYAVGGSDPMKGDDYDGIILKWDGLSWQKIPFPDENDRFYLNNVILTSVNDGWASSLYALYRWDGKTWNKFLVGEENNLFERMREFSMTGPNDLWGVGSDPEYIAAGWGVVVHWDGSKWEKILNSRYELVSLRFFAPGVGWAIGIHKDQANVRNVSSVLYEFDGKQLKEHPFEKKLVGGMLCGTDIDHAWLFGGEWIYPDDYSSVYVPSIFRLTRKQPAITPTPEPSATVTLSPTKVQAEQQEPTNLTPPVTSLTPSPNATDTAQPENPNQNAIYAVVFLLIILLGIFLIFLLRKQSR